jgi:hypothetical protein
MPLATTHARLCDLAAITEELVRRYPRLGARTVQSLATYIHDRDGFMQWSFLDALMAIRRRAEGGDDVVLLIDQYITALEKAGYIYAQEPVVSGPGTDAAGGGSAPNSIRDASTEAGAD